MVSKSLPREPPSRYSPSAKWLHWTIAFAVFVQLATGVSMKYLVPEGPTQDRLYAFHEPWGALILIVMVLRLGRRWIFGTPAPDPTLGALERRGSLGAQRALYGLLIVTAVVGWAGANAFGDTVSVFGLFTFPTLVAKNEPLSDKILVWHLVAAVIIATILVLHIGGALYHGFVKRDGVLARMLPER